MEYIKWYILFFVIVHSIIGCSSHPKIDEIIVYKYKSVESPIQKTNISTGNESSIAGSVWMPNPVYLIEGVFNKLIIKNPDTIIIYDYKKDLIIKIRNRFSSIEFIDSNRFYCYDDLNHLFLNTISGSTIKTDSINYEPFIDKNLINEWVNISGFAGFRFWAYGKVFYFDNEYIYDNFHKIKIDRATITAQPFGKEWDQFIIFGNRLLFSKKDTVFCTNLKGCSQITKYNIKLFLKIQSSENFLNQNQPIIIFKREVDIFPDILYFYNCTTNEFELENKYIKHLGDTFGFVNKEYEGKVDSVINANLKVWWN